MLSEKVDITNYTLTKLSFNFSFISRNYSIDSRNITGKLGRIILKKLQMVSAEDYEILLLQQGGNNGIETLPAEKVRESKMGISSEFSNSGRFSECSERYSVIKGSGVRIIGKINPHTKVFYVLAIDTKFELYSHGEKTSG